MATDAIISGVLDQLFIIMNDQVQELRRALGVEKEIKALSSKLNTIREVLDDAEKRSFKDKRVKTWIEMIQDFSYEADDVLDEWRTRTLALQIQRPEDAAPEIRGKVSCCSFLPSCFHFKRLVVNRDIAQKIKELDSTLDRITKEKEQFNFVAVSHPVQETKRDPTTPFVDASRIQGRDIDVSAVIRKLKEDAGEEARNGPLVISIVGTGGVGKTTLAQLVYGDEQIKTHFNERVWVCVSDPFDQIKIAKAIVESTTKSSPDLSQLGLLLEKIQSTLNEKKFLLVMDDVWTEQDEKWEPFKNCLKVGLPGSRILVTSRSERVARMMESVYLHPLGIISDSDAWLLLSRIAFSGRREEDCEKLKDIGQKIAQKCKGLPLAVKVMGSLLRCKDTEEQWQDVLDSKIWEMEKMETDLFPQLYLSYDDLTPKMKRCFSYCAVFPKDYVILVDELIRIWMAQGYLTTTSGSDHNKMELKGREVFENLAMRSFFQDLRKDNMDSNIVISCKMHDIVHDFAQFLTRKECYSLDRPDDKVEIENIRHLSCQKTECAMNPTSICDVAKLRSFFVDCLSPEQLTLDLFSGLKSVRVLRLRGCKLQELPKEIGNLFHLRYIELSLNRVKELPDAICSLYNLQTLDLLQCECLSRLPEGIGNLRHLRYIDLCWSKLEKLPDTICSLDDLQTLDLEGCECLSRLPEGIGNLRHLRYINLSGSKVEELPDTICSLDDLQTLDLGECNCLSRLPEGIGNLRHLRHINLSRSKIEELPDAICSLHDLQTLNLRGCEYLSRLSEGIGKLINLRSLDISYTNSLEMLPEGIAKLTQLHSLGEFKVGKESSKLGYMQKLNQLQGYLSINVLCDLNNAADEEEAVKAELRNKKHLEALRMYFKRGVDVRIEVMEALIPPPQLQRLEISRYGGIHFPSWITLSLDNLRYLTINGCYNCSYLPPLGKLPSLQSLWIESMKEVKYVGSEFLGVAEVDVAFPKLEELDFWYCGEWEEWEDFKEEAPAAIMPCIRNLRLGDCKKLKRVPHQLLSRMPSLMLKIERCPLLESVS